MSLERELTRTIRIGKNSISIYVIAWWHFKNHVLENEKSLQIFSQTLAHANSFSEVYW